MSNYMQTETGTAVMMGTQEPEFALGRHVIWELSGANAATLGDADLVRDVCDEAARAAGCTVVGNLYHQFEPHGASGATVLAESHLTIHTWPEYGYAAIDLFYCGDTVDPNVARDILQERFQADRVTEVIINRGPR